MAYLSYSSIIGRTIMFHLVTMQKAKLNHSVTLQKVELNHVVPPQKAELN